MQLSNQFETPRAPDDTFGLLLDAPAIVHCVPGAELTSVEADGSFKGRISVKLGPVALKFNGALEIVGIDPALRTATLKARGADLQGRGGAHAVTTLSVGPSAAGSRVVLKTDLQLSGMVAQYGRAQGVIAAVSNEIVAQFSRNLAAAMAGEEPAPGQSEISGLTLAWRALRGKA